MNNPERERRANGSRFGWVLVSVLLHLAVLVQLPNLENYVPKTPVSHVIDVDLVALDGIPEPKIPRILPGPIPQERRPHQVEARSDGRVETVARDHQAPPAARPARNATTEVVPAPTTLTAAPVYAAVGPVPPPQAASHEPTASVSAQEWRGDLAPLRPPPDDQEQGIDIAAIRMDYLTRSRFLVERHKQYPLLARKKGVEGTVMVVAVLKRDGTLLRCDIVKGSGSLLLDNAALRSVRTVTRYPQFPAGLQADVLDLRIPITFRLIAP